MIAEITIKEVKNKLYWNKLLSKLNNIPFLQTWEYGEAKRRAEGWLPLRQAIFQNNELVGVLQALRKNFLFIKITRINRGPLFFNQDKRLYTEVLRCLYSFWVEQKKTILFIAPNINENYISKEDLRDLGYNLSKGHSWSSIIIDLTLEKEDLRKNLNKKWRNLLKKSEKMELKLEIDNSDKGLTFLLDKYYQLKKEKRFIGLSGKLVREIRKTTINKISFQVIFAKKDGVRVSGILMLGCFDTCHYMIGWNSPAGRKTLANYFLLWQGLLLFKKMGYHQFDLGGINEEKTPQISHFKKGLGGNKYTLVGEFETYPNNFLSWMVKKTLNLIKIFRFICYYLSTYVGE